MDFKEATDQLFDRLDHETLARALGVSVASIRQARLRPEAAAHRLPPDDWRGAVIRLAKARKRHYEQLLDALDTEIKRDSARGGSYLHPKDSGISVS